MAKTVFLLPIAAVISVAYQSPAQVGPAPLAAPVTALGERLIVVRVPVVPPGQTATVSATHYDADSRADLPLGSHILLLDPSNPRHSSGRITSLTPGFAAAGRPDLSFDGKRVLFVAKRTPSDRFCVWEMNIDGTGRRQITTESGPCSAAIYLSAIYTIDAAEPVHQVAFSAGPGGPSGESPGPAGSLFTCRMDGRRIRRITFNPYGGFDPYLLSDGRLLFSSRPAPGDSPAAPFGGSLLLTVHPDGTDVSAFAAAHQPPAWRGMPCETADGQVVYVESKGRGWDRGGSLVAVERARSLHTRRLVAGDNEGLYHSPSPLADGNLLVSYRGKGDESYGVYVLDPRSGTRIARIIDTPEWHEVDAFVVRPRPVPAGRSSVVDERSATGFLYCMNAYLSDTEEGKRIADGRIKRLQVLRAVVLPEDDRPEDRTNPDGMGQDETKTSGWPLVTEELLGDVPVEPDGSFFLEVPAEMPFRLQTLDADGTILQAMHNWIWVMPKEGRGCIGCHEDRELTPPNRHTLALRQAPRPVGVAGRSSPP